MMLTPEYIAGFVDGEGCFTISRSRSALAGGVSRYIPCCAVVNTHRELLECLVERYGVGAQMIKVKRYPGRRQCWKAKLCGSALSALYAEVRPHLIVKAQVADVVLRCQGSMQTGECRRRLLTPDVIALRESLYQQVRQLNGYCPTKPMP